MSRRSNENPPGTLAPTADNAAFPHTLLAELTGNLRTRRIDIGADEPFELGTGRSRERADHVGLGTVCFDHLDALMRPWLQAGYTVQFWADVFGEHPELMDRLPPGAIPVVWQYEAPRTVADVHDAGTDEAANWRRLGMDVDGLREGFRTRAKVLGEAGVPFWVAPGASNWNSLLGRTANAVGNMVDAAEVGLAHDAQGFLLTSWGDHGTWEPPSIAYGPALCGAPEPLTPSYSESAPVSRCRRLAGRAGRGGRPGGRVRWSGGRRVRVRGGVLWGWGWCR